jgi:hypothetical protein
MHATMDVKDQTFHTFWQRLARWLVDGVPDRVSVTAAPSRVQKGEPVSLSAEVLDPEYKGINDGRITAHVTSPSGKIEDVPMEWTVEHDGEYRARFTPAEDGLYKVNVGGTTAASVDVGKGAASVRVAPSDREYFDAAMRQPLLERIAEETEGRFYKAQDVSQLPDAITYSGKGITIVEERELWDMPINLLLPARIDGWRVVVSKGAWIGVGNCGVRVSRIRTERGRYAKARASWSRLGCDCVHRRRRHDLGAAARRTGPAAVLPVLFRQRALRRQVRVRPHELSVVRPHAGALGARLSRRRTPLHAALQRAFQRRGARRRDQHHELQRP